MLKINKLTVENFRGIRLPITIDFYKGGKPTSAVIYGRNGSGKSSIVDSWEWLLTSKIEYLSKDGVSEKDYPHKLCDGENSYVQVAFTHPEIGTVKSLYNKTRITNPINTGDYDEFKKQAIYPNFLRYSDLQEFVFKSKGEKYKYIARFFGLEQFLRNQSDLQTSLKRLTNQLINLQNQLLNSEQIINKISGNESVQEAIVINFINSVASKYKIDKIVEFKDSWKVKQTLAKIVQANPVASELAAWKSYQIKLNQFYSLPKVVQDCANVEKVYHELKKDGDVISKLILIDLYSSASTTLAKLKDKSICPVCDSFFSGDLVQHIAKKHHALETLDQKKNDYVLKRDFIIKKLELILQRVEIVKYESNDKILETFNIFFNDVDRIALKIPLVIVELKKRFNDIEDLNISVNSEILKIDLLSDKEVEHKEIVTTKIKSLSEDQNTKDLAVNFGNLVEIISGYTNYLKIEKKVSYLSNITTNLDLIFSKLTAFIQDQIQNTFTAIQSDLEYCYNYLESSNQFLKNPVIKLVTGRDKAVELEIEFVDEKISPAYKFMSESQVNSFGLAVFLAAVKHFNSNFKFMILDDVVNSFDAFKRPKVSQLLATRFNDFQVLMLTHDQIFFDTVQKAFPQWNRYKFSSWEYTTGPRSTFANNYFEEIQNLIDHDDPIGAGQKLGRYLEMVLGILNQNLRTPITYKLENVYTLSEFYDPLIKRFKDKLKLNNKRHKISNLFDEFDQGTIFRNYCAHYKNEANQFTSQEIDGIFKKWIEIEKEVYCAQCKSYCNLSNAGNNEHVKCNCGNLNMKDESKFLNN